MEEAMLNKHKIPILMSWKNNGNHGSALAKWHSLVREKG